MSQRVCNGQIFVCLLSVDPPEQQQVLLWMDRGRGFALPAPNDAWVGVIPGMVVVVWICRITLQLNKWQS